MRGARFNKLKMCPLCCCGPLFNNECPDMSAHHGQCSVRALRDGSRHVTECTPEGTLQVPASENAARVAQMSSDQNFPDVLPKCQEHNALVIFNGCMACGHLFTDTDWNDLPDWDPKAQAFLDLNKKTRKAARLLTEQVKTEAALLQFEPDALLEAYGAKPGSLPLRGARGCGGRGLNTSIGPPPTSRPPSLPEGVVQRGDY